MIQRLRERAALDLAFITLGAAGPGMGQVGAGQGEFPDLELCLVQENAARIVMARDHPLADLSTVALADLRDITLLLYPDDLNPWLFHDVAGPIEEVGAWILVSALEAGGANSLSAFDVRQKKGT